MQLTLLKSVFAAILVPAVVTALDNPYTSKNAQDGLICEPSSKSPFKGDVEGMMGWFQYQYWPGDNTTNAGMGTCINNEPNKDSCTAMYGCGKIWVWLCGTKNANVPCSNVLDGLVKAYNNPGCWTPDQLSIGATVTVGNGLYISLAAGP